MIQVSGYRHSDSQDVIQLFVDVFADSAGQDEGLSIGRLVEDLVTTTAPGELHGWVARHQQRIIASIFFSRLRFQSDTAAFILSPVAVDTAFQGQGVGQQLIRHGIAEIRDIGISLLFTYGAPDYYARVGFHPVSEEAFRAPVKLTQPHGWLCQTLTGEEISAIAGPSQCVAALDKPEYW